MEELRKILAEALAKQPVPRFVKVRARQFVELYDASPHEDSGLAQAAEWWREYESSRRVILETAKIKALVDAYDGEQAKAKADAGKKTEAKAAADPQKSDAPRPSGPPVAS